MTVLSGQSILARGIFDPCVERQRDPGTGTSYGLGPAGYDVRLAEPHLIKPGEFHLASTMEYFSVPIDCICIVHDKSTWARRGLAVQNTVAEPGWRGYLTLELTNHGPEEIWLPTGAPVAQILVHLLDVAAERPYEGRYQDQRAGPQPATFLGEGQKV